MYCPSCAAQNSEDAKFCRSCGTSLELIALALSGKLTEIEDSSKVATVETWQKKDAKARRDRTNGAILLIVSVMLLFIPMPFLGNFFPWLIIWSVFFGWMTIWGTVELTNGIGGLIESKALLRQGEADTRGTSTTPETGLSAATGRNRVTSPDLADSGANPPSVTESTTRNLGAESLRAAVERIDQVSGGEVK